ncbi:hypothetical protein [Spiroplasma endosymbiont of Crioceris asparagi]|uniref:hypothetical protein n=1 Tax=Spiroplasma endosymbiont of Crioceris asparagi TaxID=3066286 RepID=UPI0030CB77F9
MAFTIITTSMYTISNIFILGSTDPNKFKGTILGKLLKLKYISYPYLFENLFSFHSLTEQQQQEINSFLNDNRTGSGDISKVWKKPLEKINTSRIIIKDLIFLLIGLIPYLLSYFIVERKDYKL